MRWILEQVCSFNVYAHYDLENHRIIKPTEQVTPPGGVPTTVTSLPLHYASLWFRQERDFPFTPDMQFKIDLSLEGMNEGESIKEAPIWVASRNLWQVVLEPIDSEIALDAPDQYGASLGAIKRILRQMVAEQWILDTNLLEDYDAEFFDPYIEFFKKEGGAIGNGLFLGEDLE